MNRMKLAAWLIFAVASTSQLTAAEKNGGLSGRWVMDAGHSSYGRMPLPKSCVEVIGQKVRSVSADGKTQTVETYMGEVRSNPQMKRVMLKSER
jgi:hypothetical protein